MKAVAVDHIRVAGALDRDVTGDGVVFRRLPPWTRHQITDIQLALMVTMPAGPEDADDLYDGLHPTAAGYRRIGERFHALACASDNGPFGHPLD
jgi:hypothetical protein